MSVRTAFCGSIYLFLCPLNCIRRKFTIQYSQLYLLYIIRGDSLINRFIATNHHTVSIKAYLSRRKSPEINLAKQAIFTTEAHKVLSLSLQQCQGFPPSPCSHQQLLCFSHPDPETKTKRVSSSNVRAQCTRHRIKTLKYKRKILQGVFKIFAHTEYCLVA